MKNRLATLAFFLAMTPIVAFAGPEERPTYWQLMFGYDGDSFELLEAAEIPPMLKTPSTPGLGGTPGSLVFDSEWLDDQGRPLFFGQIELPIGERAALIEGGACTPRMLSEDVVVVRCEGPASGASPATVRLKDVERRGMAVLPEFTPSVLAADSYELEVRSLLHADHTPRVPGPISATKIRDTGPDENRLTFVVVGDGYTAANLTAGSFTTAATNLSNSFTGRSPWDIYFSATNIYRIDTESNEQGSDREDGENGTLKDTYYNSTFWTSGIERLLTVDNTGRTRAFAAANSLVGVGKWDYVFVLVNSTKYGGAGGSICTSSVHPSAPDVIIHEIGHTYAQLADEYSDPYPGFPPGDSEPNVDFDSSGPGLKWLVWVDGSTPLPTPDTSTYNNTVGAFVGARYLTTGIHRPWRNCLMRSLGVNFCPICKEQHVKRFHTFTQLADSVTPPMAGTQDVPVLGTTFTATPIPISGLTYAWTIDSVPVAGASSPSLLVTPAMIGADNVNKTLRLTITDPTLLVRTSTLSENYQWTIRTSFASAGARDSWQHY